MIYCTSRDFSRCTYGLGPRVVYIYIGLSNHSPYQGLVHPTTLSACVAKPLRYLNMYMILESAEISILHHQVFPTKNSIKPQRPRSIFCEIFSCPCHLCCRISSFSVIANCQRCQFGLVSYAVERRKARRMGSRTPRYRKW